jgi:hypothetical protein
MFALARMPGTPPALHDLAAARRELDAMEARWLEMVRAYDAPKPGGPTGTSARPPRSGMRAGSSTVSPPATWASRAG